MKPGRKPGGGGEKHARGTFRPDRHGRFEEGPSALAAPIPPDWLTDAGAEVWRADAPRAFRSGMANEADSSALGTYCNLVGSILEVWASGAVPSAASLREARVLAEAFGLAGPRSRLGEAPNQRRRDHL